MDKEIIEKVLLEISTPTGLTYSGDTTICNDEVKDIMNYINNIEQQCKKQKEVINKAVNDIQEIIDAVNKNTIIAMKQFNFKLEIIQDELGGSNDILKEVQE